MKYKKIMLATQKNIKKFDEEITLILKTIGHKEALVTDLSTFWDFSINEKKLKEHSKKLGISIKGRDKLVEAAEKLVKKRIKKFEETAKEKLAKMKK